MSASGTTLEMTPLLPCRPAILSPSVIFALLRDRDADHFLHARRQVAVLVAGEDLDIHHFAALAMRQAQREYLSHRALSRRRWRAAGSLRASALFHLWG